MSADPGMRPGRIEWRLPLTIAGLLLAVVAVFSWMSYREVRASALRTASGRTEALAGQLAGLLVQSVQQLFEQLEAAAEQQAFVEALVRPSPDGGEQAREALDTLFPDVDEVRTLELWNTSGDLLASVVRSGADDGPAEAPTTPPGWATGDTSTVSGFTAVGNETRYAVATPVREGERVVGRLLLRLALDSSPEGVRQLEELIGAAFKIGAPGGTWTDGSGVVGAPPQVPVDQPPPPWYETSDGRQVVGATAAVAGAPWMAWVELPLDAVLERPRAFLAWIVPAGFAIVLLGALVGGLLSRRMTAALQNSEERFRMLASTAPDAIVTADTEGRITYFNPGAERVFGWASEDVLGRALTRLMPERFHEAHQEGIARHAGVGQSRIVGRTLELAGLRADGTEFPLELSVATQARHGDTIFTGIIRDVTERREREGEIRRYASELEAANDELEAFSYSVSHDLRAPLRAIHGFSQAVLEDHGDRLDEKGGEYLQRVCEAAERMGMLIDDLLELSRATRAELRHEPVDLSKLAERTAAALLAQAPDREVEFRIAPGLTAVGDEELLRLVVNNLIGNAWKFTATKENAVIEVAEEEGSESASFFVRDDGAGFDMEYADKLFAPFQRLHSARDFEGTGIGLALVQRIIHRHGGAVWGEGAVGEGATFHFTLPER